MKNIKLITLLTITTLFLNGCVDTEKNKLDVRVIDYWTHKINKDYASAYEFLSPGWKSNEPSEAFARRMRNSTVNWKKVKIIDKKCNETYLCDVIVEIEYEYMFRGAVGKKISIPSTVHENWLMQDNKWYHVPIKTKRKRNN